MVELSICVTFNLMGTEKTAVDKPKIIHQQENLPYPFVRQKSLPEDFCIPAST